MHLRPIEHLENRKMQTQERQLTRFLYSTTDLQRKPNWTRGFSQNRTELEKFIPHIPRYKRDIPYQEFVYPYQELCFYLL